MKGSTFELDKKIKKNLIPILAIMFASFQIYTGIFGTFNIFIQRGIHLAFGIPLIFLVYPTFKQKESIIIDLFLSALSGFIFCYLAVNNDNIVQRIIYVDPLSVKYTIIGLLGILLVLEAARRTVGSVFSALALFFFLYMVFGKYIAGIFGHRGFGLKVVVEHLFFTSEGIFGIPVGVSSTYVFLFIMFGVFLATTGAGKFFLDLVNAFVGHRVGGPAKVALFSSAAMGTLSGSAIANVVTTGTFTIPLMKKSGFEKNYAAGVEAMASTGGQLLPPVMGVAAFMMAQFSGYPYYVIAGAAIIPSILYYNSAFWQIHFYALKMKIPLLAKEGLPEIKKVLKRGWYYIVPIIVVVYFLMNAYTATLAAIYGLFCTILMNIIFGNREVLKFNKLIEAFEKTARAVLVVIGAVAAAGIIIGSLTLTGLGASISIAIMNLAKGSELFALIFTALMATILGLGIPTSGAYIICASVLIPSLIQIGIPVLSAHFFALYYASLSVITPPVALASYAAASIAGSDPWRTGVQGFKLALAAYIVPFFFVYNKALLGQGTIGQIGMALLTGLIGTFSLAAAVEGYIFKKLNIFERIMLGVVAILLIFASYIRSFLIALFIIIFVILVLNIGISKIKTHFV